VAAGEVFGSARRRTPSATLIMRVWWEASSEQPFRAQFAAIRAGGHTEVGIATSPDEALTTVSHWIEEFLSYAG
jgi:hypothetical protein